GRTQAGDGITYGPPSSKPVRILIYLLAPHRLLFAAVLYPIAAIGLRCRERRLAVRRVRPRALHSKVRLDGLNEDTPPKLFRAKVRRLQGAVVNQVLSV